MNKIYTGRQVALFTDIHGLLEPIEAILDDIKRRGINIVYSLGDNIIDGPDSFNVVKLLELNGVKCIAGNTEEYIRIGIEPFCSYMNSNREKEINSVKQQLGEEGIRIINGYSHTYEFELGGKKIGLCHFGNDVRIDFERRSTWSYQMGFDFLGTGERFDKNISKQFEYTSSKEQIEEIKKYGSMDNTLNPYFKGYMSAYNDPMFPTSIPGVGKKLEVFDDVFQGHVHFKLEDLNNSTNYHTLRAAGMGYRNDPTDSASYVILKEYIDSETDKKDFEIEEILVTFDREKMVYKVLSSRSINSRIAKFISITNDEKIKYIK